MPRIAAGLSAAKVKTAKPGQYVDGNGLRLLVRDTGARFWIFRYTIAKRTREMGMGRAGSEPGAVPLSEARKRAGELHRAVKDGRDPLAERAMAEAGRAARAQLDMVRGKTFEDVATAYIEANRAGWGNAKHAAQWTATLTTYAYPVMGKVAARDVTADLILSVLQSLWTTKPETASRVRGRIERVLDFARVSDGRMGENPARWKGNLDHMLSAPVQHGDDDGSPPDEARRPDRAWVSILLPRLGIRGDWPCTRVGGGRLGARRRQQGRSGLRAW